MSQVSIHKQQTTRRKPIECAPEPKMSKVNNLYQQANAGVRDQSLSVSQFRRGPPALFQKAEADSQEKASRQLQAERRRAEVAHSE